MGQYAESMINGECDMYTGEYIGNPCGYPRKYSEDTNEIKRYKRTPVEKKIASIRKEIALDIKSGTKVEEARRKANLKYGKGWRERGLAVNDLNQWSEEDLKPFL